MFKNLQSLSIISITFFIRCKTRIKSNYNNCVRAYLASPFGGPVDRPRHMSFNTIRVGPNNLNKLQMDLKCELHFVSPGLCMLCIGLAPLPPSSSPIST